MALSSDPSLPQRSDMKASLHRLLPPRTVQTLAGARRSVERSLASAVVGLLGRLPGRVAANARERWSPTGRLDYARGTIRLSLESATELPRLDSCQKEPETVAWIERFIRPDQVVYDVGANVGAYSLVIDAATGGRSVVYAFEPSFSTFAQLCRNVALNRCSERVIPIQLALSDTNGLASFNYSSTAPGAAMHALGQAVDQVGRPFQPAFTQHVLAYRLDDFVEQLGARAPQHLKIDVDGSELRVLQGATRTLRNGVETVMVEVEPGGPDFRAVTRLLADSGFEVHARYPHGEGEDATANHLFVRSGVSR